MSGMVDLLFPCGGVGPLALPAALDGVQSSGLVRCICEDDAVIREDSLNGDFLAAETSSDLDPGHSVTSC